MSIKKFDSSFPERPLPRRFQASRREASPGLIGSPPCRLELQQAICGWDWRRVNAPVTAWSPDEPPTNTQANINVERSLVAASLPFSVFWARLAPASGT